MNADGMIRETVLLASDKEIVCKIMEVANDESINDLSMEERQCRFSNERTLLGNQMDIYPFYSFSTCLMECMILIQMEYCNCSSHQLVADIKMNEIQICDYMGLSCLDENFSEILSKRKSCDCMSPCDEPEYDIVYNSADEE